MLEDIEDLLCFADSAARNHVTPSASSRREAPRPHALPDPGNIVSGISDDALVDHLACLEAAGLDDDILVSCAGDNRPKRKYEARSWQLTHNARQEKTIKHLRCELDQAIAGKQLAEVAVNIVAAETRPTRVQLEPDALALTKWRLVAQGSRRGLSSSQRSNVARSAAQCADAIEATQTASRDAMLLPSVVEQSSSSSSCGSDRADARVHVYVHGFDETMQRLQRLRSKGGACRGKFSGAQVSQSVMMQHGYWVRCVRTGSVWTWAQEEWFCKACILESTKASGILQGLLRRVALPLGDPDAMLAFTRDCDALIICLAIDKAGVNFVLGAWVYKEVVLPTLGVGLHVEPCGAHALAVAKSRSSNGGRLASAIGSFAKLTKQSKLLEELIDSTAVVVKSSFVRHFSKRPQEYVDRAERVIQALRPVDMQDNALPHTDADGGDLRPAFMKLVVEYLRHMHTGAPEDTVVHYCWVEDRFVRW